MDGLSAAANGIAVASISIQLAECTKKLCDFWDSIKEAPEDIRTISIDIKLLSTVLTQIAHEAQHIRPNETLIFALEGCWAKVRLLTHILNEIEPGFASKNSRTRKWTALKAAFKDTQLKKFQDTLERTKGTLSLIQQLQMR